MNLTILSALLLCWIGGMVMGAAVIYGILRQQRNPKSNQTVEAERVTVDPEGSEQLQQDKLEWVAKDVMLDVIDEISFEIDQGLGFRYTEWRKFIRELPGLHIHGME